MDFGAIIPCVLSGQASIAIAQFEGTPERANNIDFSEPYCVARLMLLSLTSTPVRLPVPWKNKIIVVQLGSTHHSYASRELAANEPTLELVVYNRVGEMVQDLKNGRLQAILLDQSTAEPIAAKEQLFKTLMPAMGRHFSTEDMGHLFNKCYLKPHTVTCGT